MNYRHAFHAGNFADVVKHILLLGLLEHMNRKDSPYCYIDSHAGTGVYNLAGEAAKKTSEADSGIGKLQGLPSRGQPAWIRHYLNLIRDLRTEHAKPTLYPGSPWLALSQLRPQDRAVLLELHPQDAGLLRHNLQNFSQIAIHERDAYEGLPALVPPKEKRGLVLIDPPYEKERDDFKPVVELLVKAHQKWPTGTYAIWYPIKDKRQIARFHRLLQQSGIPKLLALELHLYPADNALGLNGTGLIVANPPWQYADTAESVLAWLEPVLACGHPTQHKVWWLAGE